MTCDHDNQLSLVRQLRELGAVEIELEGLRVRFASPPALAPLPDPLVQAASENGKTPSELMEYLRKQREDELESILFHSVDP